MSRYNLDITPEMREKVYKEYLENAYKEYQSLIGTTPEMLGVKMKDNSLSDTQGLGDVKPEDIGKKVRVLIRDDTPNLSIGGWPVGNIGKITKVMENNLKEISVLEKEIWNAAVEECAKYLICTTAEAHLAVEIRKLKK